MSPIRQSRNDPGWQSDPAVDAGFAAAYRDDQWQDDRWQDDAAPEPDEACAPVDSAVVPSTYEGAPASPVVPAQPGPSLTPSTEGAAGSRVGVAPLVRPPLRPGRPAHPSGSDHRPRGRAVAGAAVAVGGVLLGIGSLLWVTDEPTRSDSSSTAAPVSVTSVPSAQAAPAGVETAPPDTPVQSAPLAGPAPVAPDPVPAPAPAAAEPEAPSSPVVPVTVLNNSDRDGLADRAAVRFERGGWPVQATGNFRGRIPVTTVYYDRGLEASARAFADTFPGMVRVRPRFETLPARGVVVVLTREYPT